MQTTYEQAARCPKCDNPGEVRNKTPAPGLPKGTMVHYIYCVHQLCPWFNTPWIVQVNPDGSIPPASAHLNQPKVYVGFEGHDQAARDIIAALEEQQRIETGGGGEVRNPFAR